MDATTLTYLVVGTGFLLGALGLLGLNFGDRLNRAFSLYLILEGGAMITLTIDRGGWFETGLRGLFYYLNLAAPYALLYLAACYRDRFGQPGLRRIALPVLVGMAALVLGLYLWDPGLVSTGARPLRPIHYLLVLLGPAILAALLAHDATTTPKKHRRRHLWAASLGFAFYPTAFALHLFIPDLMSVRPFEAWIALLGLAPIAYLLVQLVRVARTTDEARLRVSARNYLAIFALSPLSVAILWWVRGVGTDAQAEETMRILMTGWLLVMAGLVAYAILRHQLFGIEIGVKWTLRRGMLPAALVATFFIVEQLLQEQAQAIPGPGAWLGSGLAAGLLALGYRPLQRMADRFADVAMPEVKPGSEYTALRRLQLYQSALAAAWEDGILTRDERLRLDRLRERLQLSIDDAASLESEYGMTLLKAVTGSA